MALDLTALQEFVRLNPQILKTKIYQDTVLRRLAVRTIPYALPGTYRTRIFSPVANLSACCSTPTSQSNVSEFDLKVICVMDGSEYCEVDLSQLITSISEQYRFTSGLENAGDIARLITEGQLAAFTEAIDKLTFQGDTTSADPNLNQYDGLIKELSATTSASIKLTINSGDVVSAINQVAMSIPYTARQMGKIAIFVGREYYDAYMLALIRMNLYHYNPGTASDIPEDINVLGFSNFVIVPTRGLDGTNKIIATPIENIVWMTNRVDDHNVLTWSYSEYHQKYFWRVKTIFGVGIALQDWAVIATVAPTVLTTAVALNVAITSPVDATSGGVKTTATT